eukprot:Nitzschia sp. Nitz4//scaffold66_size103028//25257//26051//NITZ4_004493-RA/size103028-processed-gene-0.26-mRNA-1//-1//CDS//3329556335//2995//frame0
MFANHFFNDFDDHDYYYGGTPHRALMHRRRAEEEARRRAEIERYLRQKELEEEERRQRQEYARLLRQRQLEEEAYEREMRRRQQEYYRSLYGGRAESPAQTSSSEEEGESAEEDENEEPIYQLVRGLDGRIYKVLTNPNRVRKQKQPSVRKESVTPKKQSQQQSLFDRDAHQQASRSTPQTSAATLPLNKENEHTINEVEHEPPIRRKVSRSMKKDKKSKKKNSKKVTIIVEDASDSEAEDFYMSPWRNRRPSPGQWLEPVEAL